MISEVNIHQSYPKDSTTRSWKNGKLTLTKAQTTTLKSDFFLKIFLPAGYPNSVKKDYRNYQIYDSFQALFSSLTGILATKQLLKGYGVGNDQSSASDTALTFILKDGISMVTRIWFAYQFSPHFMVSCSLSGHQLTVNGYVDGCQILAIYGRHSE